VIPRAEYGAQANAAYIYLVGEILGGEVSNTVAIDPRDRIVVDLDFDSEVECLGSRSWTLGRCSLLISYEPVPVQRGIRRSSILPRAFAHAVIVGVIGSSAHAAVRAVVSMSGRLWPTTVKPKG
jgi:hypothetical protein